MRSTTNDLGSWPVGFDGASWSGDFCSGHTASVALGDNPGTPCTFPAAVLASDRARFWNQLLQRCTAGNQLLISLSAKFWHGPRLGLILHTEA